MTTTPVNNSRVTKRSKKSLLKRLHDMPFLAWAIILTIVCYWVWHPVVNIPSLWTVLSDGLINDNAGMSYPARALLFAGTALMLFIAYKAANDSIGMKGKIAILVIISLFVWLFVDNGWLDINNATFWQWIFQPAIGLTLAVGVCWTKVWFALTGRRGVSDPDTSPDDHADEHDDAYHQ